MVTNNNRSLNICGLELFFNSNNENLHNIIKQACLVIKNILEESTKFTIDSYTKSYCEENSQIYQ